MIRTTNFDALVAECTSIEQIVALGMFALYDRSYPSNFITTGIASDGTDIRSRKAQVWTGNQIVAENTMEEQTVMTLALPIDKSHRTSDKPWLKIGFISGETDTPNAPFA